MEAPAQLQLPSFDREWTAIFCVGKRGYDLRKVTPLADRISSIQELALFSDLSPIACDKIIATAERKSVCETVFSEGDPVRRVMLLLSGCVKVTKLTISGDEVILRLCGTGELIGTFDLGADCRHSSTAQPLEPSIVLSWQVDLFEKLMECFPMFRRNVLRDLQVQILELEHRFGEVASQSVAARLSSQLIRLSERFGRRVNGCKELHLSQRDLAQLTATTLYTVSRLLSRWQRLGIVSVRKGAVQVHKLDALAEFATTG